MRNLDSQLGTAQANIDSNANSVNTFNTQVNQLATSMNAATKNTNDGTDRTAATKARLNSNINKIKQPMSVYFTALAADLNGAAASRPAAAAALNLANFFSSL